MGIHHILQNPHFNIFFSVILGIGIICMIRKPCTGSECTVNKPPIEEDFDKYVYRMNGGKCYEFKTEVMECPASGAIEAFQTHHAIETREKGSQFSNRRTPIQKCDSL
jgi:hypothetical protein